MPKLALVLLGSLCCSAVGQVGSLRGRVMDATGAPVPSAAVVLAEVRTVITDSNGEFRFTGVTPGTYRLRISAAGFRTAALEASLDAGATSDLAIKLEIEGGRESVTVEAAALPDARTEASETVDRNLLAALPALGPDSGLNDAIVYTTPGVAADSNGFFHPMGDHSQVSFVIDGQPITDQRNKVFSTSIPANAIQSMDVIYGSPSAEFGDKTSLVVNATTRSGLGQKTAASFTAYHGSFGTIGEEGTLMTGGARWGNFTALNAERTGRFLDTPEFRPMHDVGNTGTLFDRIDLLTGARGALHVNLMAARNWLQIPTTYDQPRQDQRQKVVSYNVAPGYQRTIDSRSVWTLNTFLRGDWVNYYPSRDAFDDQPATLSQRRSLTNFGFRTDYAYAAGRHEWKAGAQASMTRLDEEFRLGLTDPLYHLSPDYTAGLARYDLTRGGRMYEFLGRATIRQAAAFAQDAVRFGGLTLNVGLRWDLYRGLSRGGGLQPRGSFSYLVKRTQTVIRGGFSHTVETPVNENLVASSSTGQGGLASNLFGGGVSAESIGLGSRNQYDWGVQQLLGKWLRLDVNMFRKYTRNAFDVDALFSTPVTFPIGWRQSKLDGVSARISTPEIHGLRVWATMGHANARFFGPEVGGLIFNSSLNAGAYRQDHDQVYQQNVNLHYQPKRDGWWGDFTWRYDSGLVVGAVNNMDDALALTADQQSMIGLYCGAERASLGHRITRCASSDYGAERMMILAPGTENDDHNPPRTKSRSVFSVSAGTDNLFHAERIRTTLRMSVVNLANVAALYNFLSPFGGTHWVGPRSYEVRLGWKF